MIFYFSGAGNSLWLAKKIGLGLGCEPVAVAAELKKHPKECRYTIAQDEPLVLVFPVHYWGPATMMLDFISVLSLDGYSGQPVYALCTCGDNCGLTDRIISAALASRGIRLTACGSLQMPNTFVLMKGFGVDAEAVRDAKLAAAPAAADRILAEIRKGGSDLEYVAGPSPFFKSRVIYPWFRKIVVKRKKAGFAAGASCIGCGLCERVCPAGTVTMKDGHPVWGGNCVQCTACIHRCPVRAIEYGKISVPMGRYVHPSLKAGE